MQLIYIVTIATALSVCGVQGQNIKFYTYDPKKPVDIASGNYDGDLKYRLNTVGLTEDISPGTLIGTLKAFVEGKPDAVIHYSCNSRFFIVDKITGDTRTSTAKLDYEVYEDTANEFSIHMEAEHKFTLAGSNKTQTIQVQSVVKMILFDANDNAPEFNKKGAAYSADVSENAPVGTTFDKSINCTDKDTGFHAQISFSCHVPGGTPSVNQTQVSTAALACEYFGVRTTLTGSQYVANIYTKKPLDFEKISTFAMSLIAVDDPDQKGKVQLTSSSNIQIVIIDEQDQPPIFTNASARIFIQEHSPVGLQVGPYIRVADGDQGSRRNLSISIEDPENLFKMIITKDADLLYTVRLEIAKEIDRENTTHTSSYSFNIVATELTADGTKTSAITKQRIDVSVTDINDNAPEFDKDVYTVNMLEPETKSVLIVPALTLQVVDLDGTSFNNFTVKTVSQTFADTFRMSPDSGVGRGSFIFYIEKLEHLDYENPIYRNHEIRVTAFDNQNPTLTSTAVIKINILDRNDNKPIFNPPSYLQSIREDAVVGYSILRVKADDKDSGENGRITYRLDTDYQEFRLNASTGELFVNKTLNFEKQTTYEMFVEASDNGQVKKIGYASLKIEVTNYNDIGPKFTRSSYTSTLKEKSINLTPPVQVTATDAEGDNITYSIVSGDTTPTAFDLHPTTGVLTVKRFISVTEATDNSYFKLKIKASDNGNPPQETEAEIIVFIQDINDKIPKFNSTKYTETISEIADGQSFVLQVFATDDDTGSNGQIRYEIEKGSLDDFVIDSIKGIISVRSFAVLDYDDNKQYDMSVLAVDNGSPPQTGSTSVVITLTDANNKLPKVQVVYSRNIPENIPVGSSVIDINATDTDSNSDLEYTIPVSSITAKSKNVPIATSQYEYRTAFSIDPRTGLITVAKSLEYDKDWSIEFRVEVSDKNAEKPKVQIATSNIFITISDQKNPKPEFDSPWTRANPVYPVTIEEELPDNRVVTTMLARDPDKTLLTNYQEIPGLDVDDYFSINQTSGQVKVNKRIDYEALNDIFPVQLKMEVKAVSSVSGLSATATIVFSIQDKNDNKPVFTAKNYSVNVGENTVHPEVVTTVYATDKDSGSNKDFTYDLSGPYSNHFEIVQQQNPEEGQVIVAQNVTLDYENPVTRTYKLQIIARSSGDTGTDAIAPLTIHILDYNDNPPIFTKNEYRFFCVESLQITGFVGLVEATDKDSGPNSQIIYSLINPGTDLFFLSEQGQLRVQRSLAGASTKSPYLMKVLARDSGNPSWSSTATLNITVSSGQQDKGLPVFSHPRDANTTVTVYENAAKGYIVMEAKASARTPGAGVTFAFFSNTEIESKFSISVNGVVKVIGDLDRETKDNYDVIISATDNKNSTLVSTRKVTIRILDVDDNSPSFKSCKDRQYSDPVEVTLREGSPAETFVFEALACDNDLPPYNAIVYKLHFDNADCQSSIDKYLRLDTSRGILRTKMEIDREEKSSLFVCIQALSGSSAGRRKRATNDDMLRIRINILDINDKGPTFTVGKLTKVMFSLPKQDSITSVLAVDPDSSFYNKVRYSIMDIIHLGSGRVIRTYGAFNINPDTGELIVSFSSYRAFLSGYFNVTIKAEDFYDSSMYDTTWVQIYVGEELDQVRVVTDTDYKVDIVTSVKNMLQELQNNHPGWIFQETQIRYHKDVSGAYITSKTDVCLLIVKGGEVLDAFDGAQTLDDDKAVLQKYGFKEGGMCEPVTTKELEGDYILWWVIVALAIFMFLILVILIAVLRVLYNDYKHFMQTRQQYLVPIQN